MKVIKELNAIKLRILLLLAFSIVIIGNVGLAYLSIQFINSSAIAVQGDLVRAEESDGDAELMRRKIAVLSENADVTSLASQIVGKRESYEFQNEAFKDLLSIAKRAGVSINRYSFSDSPNGTDSTSSSNPRTKTTSGNSAGGFSPTYITLTLDNPVDYRNYLNFIHYIEQNLTKMQIGRISLSGGAEDSTQAITDSLTVEVYTK